MICVDERWHVNVSAPSSAGAAQPNGEWAMKYSLRRVIDGKSRAYPQLDPSSLAPAAAPASTGLAAADGNAIGSVFDRIADRKPEPDDAVTFGQYLFDTLLAPAWTEIQARASERNAEMIELALCWDRGDADLSRLNWELMYGPQGFVTNGFVYHQRVREVAVTRVVPETVGEARPVSLTPRILFVVGTTLRAPDIRPAAEALGVLTQAKKNRRRFHARILESATSEAIALALESFQPDVVHFICHGGIDPVTRAGYLQLTPDEKSRDGRHTADQIGALLRTRATGKYPAMVVLSACDSATVLARPCGVDCGPRLPGLLGPQGVAPLAAELVWAGVPVVVGMSGRIADRACRLFTRRFAEALVQGEPLISATAEGRRAAFTQGVPPARSVDWAFPTVFLSARVSPDYVPAEGGAAPTSDALEALVTTYDLESDPVFCGRLEFFDALRETLQAGDKVVLAAYVNDKEKGYGRTRLLEELTFQALLDGHVPCLVSSRNEQWECPKTPIALASAVGTAIQRARTAFDLSQKFETPSTTLRSYSQGLITLQELDPELKQALIEPEQGIDISKHEVTARAAMVAIQRELVDLIRDAREKHENRLRPESRAILLLDDVHEYDKALPGLLGRLTGDPFGLGIKDEPVPVVLAFSLRSSADSFLDPIVQKPATRPRWSFVQLGRFETGEDMLAYGRVLLNPFNPTLFPGVSDKPWVMDYDVDPGLVTKFEAKFRTRLRRIPADFHRELFFQIAEFASEESFLKDAHDEAKLAEMRQVVK